MSCGREILHDQESEFGFSLIEVLVTLMLISAVLIPLFQMQQALDYSSVKSKQSSTLIRSSETMISFISTINPMVEPKGEQDLANLTFEWESKKIESFQRPGSIADLPKNIALFELSYELLDKNGDILESNTVKKIGWDEDISQSPN